MMYESNEIDIRCTSERRLCNPFIEAGLLPIYPCYITLANIHKLSMAKVLV